MRMSPVRHKRAGLSPFWAGRERGVGARQLRLGASVRREASLARAVRLTGAMQG
jgi:hypothetical protein